MARRVTRQDKPSVESTVNSKYSVFPLFIALTKDTDGT